MAKRKDAVESKNTATQPDAAPAASETKNELPVVESPSISPMASSFIGPSKPAFAAELKPAPALDAEPSPAVAGMATTSTSRKSRFVLSRRQRRSTLFAASVALAAGIGAVIGALANASFAPPAKLDTAALSERKAMQRTITHLSKEMSGIRSAGIEAANKAAKEIATLKSNLDAANRTTSTQLAKASERIDKMEHQAQLETQTRSKTAAAAPETTGSIGTQHAAAETTAPKKPPVVEGWVVRAAHNGFVYVQGRSGIYQVVPGAPLPGLGPVETIKRQDGRWVVVTPKGIIVSMRDRPYFAPY